MISDADRPFWSFKQYPLVGKGAITKWRKKCKAYDGNAEIEFETVINTLSAIKNKQLWGEPEYKTMASWEGIGELRFKNVGGKPLRVFGFFRDSEREFIMLAGATHDGKKYDPSDIRDICISRRKEIEGSLDTPVDFSFEDDDSNDDDYLEWLFK